MELISSDSTVPPQITCDLRTLDPESFKKTIEEQISFGWPDVTDQEKVFVAKYLVHFSHRKAAEESGIEPGNALKVLRDPLINAYVKWMRGNLEARELITREMVAHRWLEALPKLSGEEPIQCITKDGQEVSAKKYHASEYVRALVELSRISNLTPQEELINRKPHVNVTLNFSGLAPQLEIQPIDAEVIK